MSFDTVVDLMTTEYEFLELEIKDLLLRPDSLYKELGYVNRTFEFSPIS